MSRVVANNNTFQQFFCCSLMLSQKRIFHRLNQKHFLQYPSLQWSVKFERIGHEQYETLWIKFKFAFVIKIKKIIFLEVTKQQLVKVHKQNVYSVFNMIRHIVWSKIWVWHDIRGELYSNRFSESSTSIGYGNSNSFDQKCYKKNLPVGIDLYCR